MTANWQKVQLSPPPTHSKPHTVHACTHFSTWYDPVDDKLKAEEVNDQHVCPVTVPGGTPVEMLADVTTPRPAAVSAATCRVYVVVEVRPVSWY